MEKTPLSQAPISTSRPSSLGGLYLQRLQRLLRLRHRHEQELNTQGLRLLNHSVFAAYCDCRDVGVEKEAREVLREANVTLERPTGLLDMADAAPGPEASSQGFGLHPAPGAWPEG